jgi:hypothetical protein
MTIRATRPGMVAGFIAAMTLGFAMLLALPGETITTAYVNDLFIFLDGAHRIVLGQVPNRDFHTALGPIVYYIPAAGFWVSGQLGAAMPIGIGLVIVALAPGIAHILGSRLRPVIALPYGIFLLLILAAPMNLGEGITALTFGMFYNRIGWAALAALLVLYLRPEAAGPRQQWLDAVSAAVLAIAMLYLKITYGLVALAFLVFMLLDRGQRRWAAVSLAVTGIAVLTIELFWRSSAAHFADLLGASRVSGGLRSLEDVVSAILNHLTDYVLFGLVAGLALHRRRSFRDLLFYGLCAVAGLLIMIQNSQPWGIITLHAGAVVAAETIMRSPDTSTVKWHWPAAAAPLLVLALIAPTIVHCALALGLHAALAATRSGEAFGLPGFERIRLVKLWSPFDYEFSARYVASMRAGAETLAQLEPRASHVVVLDFVNPFSASLGLVPPRGDISWMHWRRNLDASYFIPPEELFRDVRVVMEPTWGINPDPLHELYGPYLTANFELIRETESWKVHLSRHWKQDTPPQPATASAPAAAVSPLGAMLVP